MNLFKKLYTNAKFYSDVIAINTDEQKVTYGRLWELISINRNHLLIKGISKKVVAYKISNQLDFIVDFISLLAAECWVIPIPPDTEFKEPTIDVDEIILLSKEDFTRIPPLSSLEKFQVNETRCGIYHMTSGSLGEVKLCKRSACALVLEGESYKKILSLCNSKVLSMAPTYHSFALGAACMASLLSTSSLYVIDKFLPRKCIEIIDAWRVNILVGVPIMIKSLSYINIDQKYDYSCLTNVMVGTGSVDEVTAKCFENRFGINISANYGSTETGGIITRMRREPNASIGQAMPGVDVKIILPDGSEASVGETGEAYVKCGYMMEKYVCGEDCFSTEGYYQTGDLMKKDDQNNYYVVGRKKNIINIGGKKVNPYEVEKVLVTCPYVKDCVVVKGIRKKGDEFVKAIIASDKADESYIRQFMLNKLAEYKIPSIMKFVDHIERNETGKYLLNDME